MYTDNSCYLCKYLTFSDLGDSGCYLCTLVGQQRSCHDSGTSCEYYCSEQEE
ncbi:MAG: hypothetical protein Q8920_04565 [Bacillota bacterium]|nr:hypothetical protein [Bacillota bacterium]